MIARSVVLACPLERAFVLFTAQIGAWWPPERRHTGDPNSQIYLLESGRFFERSESGVEVELGAVVRWEAPTQLVLDWYPGTSREQPTRVEVRFASVADGTRLTIEHSATAESEALFPSRAAKYQASWALVLEALERAAALDNG